MSSKDTRSTSQNDLSRMTKQKLIGWLTQQDQRLPGDEKLKPYYLQRAKNHLKKLKENEMLQNTNIVRSRTRKKVIPVSKQYQRRTAALNNSNNNSGNANTNTNTNTNNSSRTPKSSKKTIDRTGQHRRHAMQQSPSISRSGGKRIRKVVPRRKTPTKQSPNANAAIKRKRARVRRATLDPSAIESLSNTAKNKNQNKKNRSLKKQTGSTSDSETTARRHSSNSNNNNNNNNSRSSKDRQESPPQINRRKYPLNRNPESMTIASLRQWLQNHNIRFEVSGKRKLYYVNLVQMNCFMDTEEEDEEQHEDENPSQQQQQNKRRLLSKQVSSVDGSQQKSFAPPLKRHKQSPPSSSSSSSSSSDAAAEDRRPQRRNTRASTAAAAAAAAVTITVSKADDLPLPSNLRHSPLTPKANNGGNDGAGKHSRLRRSSRLSPKKNEEYASSKNQSAHPNNKENLRVRRRNTSLLATPTLNRTGIARIDTPSKDQMREEIRSLLLTEDDEDSDGLRKYRNARSSASVSATAANAKAKAKATVRAKTEDMSMRERERDRGRNDTYAHVDHNALQPTQQRQTGPAAVVGGGGRARGSQSIGGRMQSLASAVASKFAPKQFTSPSEILSSINSVLGVSTVKKAEHATAGMLLNSSQPQQPQQQQVYEEPPPPPYIPDGDQMSVEEEEEDDDDEEPPPMRERDAQMDNNNPEVVDPSPVNSYTKRLSFMTNNGRNNTRRLRNSNGNGNENDDDDDDDVDDAEYQKYTHHRKSEELGAEHADDYDSENEEQLRAYQSTMSRKKRRSKSLGGKKGGRHGCHPQQKQSKKKRLSYDNSANLHTEEYGAHGNHSLLASSQQINADRRRNMGSAAPKLAYLTATDDAHDTDRHHKQTLTPMKMPFQKTHGIPRSFVDEDDTHDHASAVDTIHLGPESGSISKTAAKTNTSQYCLLLLLSLFIAGLSVFIAKFDGVQHMEEWKTQAIEFAAEVYSQMPEFEFSMPSLSFTPEPVLFCDLDSDTIANFADDYHTKNNKLLQCLPCPPHSKQCKHGLVFCKDTFILRGQLCVRDKAVVQFGYDIERQILMLLSQLNGRKACGYEIETSMSADQLMSHINIANEHMLRESFDYCVNEILPESSHIVAKQSKGKTRYYSHKSIKSVTCVSQEWILDNAMWLLGTLVACGCIGSVWCRCKRKQWENTEVSTLNAEVFDVLEEQQSFNQQGFMSVEQVKQHLKPSSDSVWAKVDALVQRDSNIQKSMRMIDGLQRKCWKLSSTSMLPPTASMNHNLNNNSTKFQFSRSSSLNSNHSNSINSNTMNGSQQLNVPRARMPAKKRPWWSPARGNGWSPLPAMMTHFRGKALAENVDGNTNANHANDNNNNNNNNNYNFQRANNNADQNLQNLQRNGVSIGNSVDNNGRGFNLVPRNNNNNMRQQQQPQQQQPQQQPYSKDNDTGLYW